eukprot:gene41867-4948_t
MRRINLCPARPAQRWNYEVIRGECDPRSSPADFTSLVDAGFFRPDRGRGRGSKQPYACPCYTTPRRGDAGFVCTLRHAPVMRQEDALHWTLRGVAAICAPD